MIRCRFGLPCLLVVLIASLSSPVAFSEIYKWVDAQGNVHFGDKPHDPAEAAEAQEVELNEGYRPTERTAQEQEAYLSEQRLQAKRNQAKQRSEQKAKEKKTAQKLEEANKKAELCAAYKDEIKRLTTIDTSGPIPTYTYIEEDGKSVSSQRQREIVAELKADMAAAGCP